MSVLARNPEPRKPLSFAPESLQIILTYIYTSKEKLALYGASKRDVKIRILHYNLRGGIREGDINLCCSPLCVPEPFLRWLLRGQSGLQKERIEQLAEAWTSADVSLKHDVAG